MSEIRAGKKKFLQIFSKKSKEEKVSNQEDILQQLKIEIKALDTICCINNERIIQNDLPEFKKTKSEKHEIMLRTFAVSSSNEFDELSKQLKPLSDIYSGILQEA